MKELKKRIIELVKTYAVFDKEASEYKDKEQLDDETKQKIEVQLITLFARELTLAGTDAAKMKPQLKKLRHLFHPKELNKQLTSERKSDNPAYIDSVKWLEQTLSKDEINNNDNCFKLIEFCVDQLNTARHAKVNKYSKAKNIPTLLKMLEKEYKDSKTYTHKLLLFNAIDALKSFEQLKGTTERIPTAIAKEFFRKMPFLTGVFCISFYIEDLALAYAVSFLISKSGKLLEKVPLSPIKILGQQMQYCSNMLFDIMTAFTLRLLQLNLFAVDSVLFLGVESGAGIYKLLPGTASATANLELTPFSEHDFLSGRRFKTLELKLIAQPLEQYIGLQGMQMFATYRLGQQKNALIQNFLGKLSILDEDVCDSKIKIIKAKTLLKSLAEEPLIKTPGAASSYVNQALDIAQTILKTDYPHTKKLICGTGA